MKQVVWFASALVLLVLPLGAYLTYFLPSTMARLCLLSIFLVPVVLLSYFASKGPVNRRIFILLGLIVFVAPAIVFVTDNVNEFYPFLGGIQSSGTRMLAESYGKNGALVFSDAHSYFFLTSFLLYLLSSICGISLTSASIIVISLHVVLMGAVGLYAARVIMKSVSRPELSFVPYLVTFSLFSSSNMMFTNIAYRYLASPLFLLLLFFYYDRNCGNRPRRTFFIVTLTLTLGITFGDPTSALIMIPLFLIVSLLRKRTSDSLYAIIPTVYMVYSGTPYLSSLWNYATFAWEGITEFLQDLLRLRFPSRVLPWQRVTSIPAQDAFLTSAAYLSLLLLSTIVSLLYIVLWIRKKGKSEGVLRDTLMKAVCLVLLTTVAISALTYVGASVKPEVSFSDIRTIAMIFSSGLLLFSFTSKATFTSLTRNRFVLLLILSLLIMSSLRVIYRANPKSINDSINVVEDPRLDPRSTPYCEAFLDAFYVKGSVTSDYKTMPRLENFQSRFYSIRLISNVTLANPVYTIIIFNLNGLNFKSVYVSPEAYAEAYNMSLTQNLVYNNGDTLVLKRR